MGKGGGREEEEGRRGEGRRREEGGRKKEGGEIPFLLSYHIFLV